MIKQTFGLVLLTEIGVSPPQIERAIGDFLIRVGYTNCEVSLYENSETPAYRPKNYHLPENQIHNITCSYCKGKLILINYDEGDVFVTAACPVCGASVWGFADEVFSVLAK